MDKIRLQILEEVIEIVSRETNIPVASIKAHYGKGGVSDARHMFLAYMATYCPVYYSLPEIARFIDHKHTTVLYSKQQVQNRINTEKPYKATFMKVIEHIGESELLKSLIWLHLKKKDDKQFTIEELEAVIKLIKKQLAELNKFLATHANNPYRIDVLKDKRDLETELSNIEAKYNTLKKV